MQYLFAGSLAGLLTWFVAEYRDHQRLLVHIRTEQTEITKVLNELKEGKIVGVPRTNPQEINSLLPIDSIESFKALQSSLRSQTNPKADLVTLGCYAFKFEIHID